MTHIKLLFIVLGLILIGAACTPGKVQTQADGGVWVTESNGEEWEHRDIIYQDRTSKKTIGTIDISEFIFSPIDDRKIFAIGKRSGVWVSWNEGYFWDLILADNKITDIAIHPQDTRRIYASVGSIIVVSEDEGVHWRTRYTSDNSETIINSIVLDPITPSTLYASTNSGNILISNDHGVTWRIHSSPKVALQNIQFHPNKPGIMYAMVMSKGLARSKDKGKNWEYFDTEFSSYKGANTPRDYVLIPSGIVYASKYGLLRSLNHGEDWVSLPLISGANDANIYSLAVNPTDPLEIFYGTKSSLYQSLDGGFNWIPRQLPSTRTATELSLHPTKSNTLYMGVSLPQL